MTIKILLTLRNFDIYFHKTQVLQLELLPARVSIKYGHAGKSWSVEDIKNSYNVVPFNDESFLYGTSLKRVQYPIKALLVAMIVQYT